MILHVDHTHLHMLVMVHGTLVELSTRYLLGIHVYSYEDSCGSDMIT